jgi:hypothetical protein
MASTEASRVRRILDRRGAVAVTVVGPCMEPLIRRGQVVLACRPGKARVGDVALLDAPGRMVVHRLLGRAGAGGAGWFVHMGDAAAACGVARPHQVLGIIPEAPRRSRPAPGAHALALLLQLASCLLCLGFPASMPSAIRLGLTKLRTQLRF